MVIDFAIVRDMAAVRSKAQVPVGSTRWVLDERQQVAQFIHQEAEDFVFSARNELDWLNEHMAEIFSSSQLYDWQPRFTRDSTNYVEQEYYGGF